MPIYQYYCDQCNTTIEVLQSFDKPAPICKKCNIKLKKIISISSFVFKGDGWSADGYSKNKKPAKKKG